MMKESTWNNIVGMREFHTVANMNLYRGIFIKKTAMSFSCVAIDRVLYQ